MISYYNNLHFTMNKKSNTKNIYNMRQEDKTQNICNQAFKSNKASFICIPNKFKTQIMCNKAVQFNCKFLQHVPIIYKTFDMCFNAFFGPQYTNYLDKLSKIDKSFNSSNCENFLSRKTLLKIFTKDEIKNFNVDIFEWIPVFHINNVVNSQLLVDIVFILNINKIKRATFNIFDRMPFRYINKQMCEKIIRLNLTNFTKIKCRFVTYDMCMYFIKKSKKKFIFPNIYPKHEIYEMFKYFKGYFAKFAVFNLTYLQNKKLIKKLIIRSGKNNYLICCKYDTRYIKPKYKNYVEALFLSKFKLSSSVDIIANDVLKMCVCHLMKKNVYNNNQICDKIVNNIYGRILNVESFRERIYTVIKAIEENSYMLK